MKIINEIDGTERNETRTEILARHAEMREDHTAKMNFLAEIHRELGLDKVGIEAAAEEQKELAERHQNEGLTHEINTSTTLVSLRDTVESCVEIIRRHPYGYKNGSRNSKGHVIDEPYTEAENLEAEKWATGLNGQQN